MSKRKKSRRFVSRGGDKLDGALDDLGMDVSGLVVADLGANVGGFTDCLLQRGAARVYAVDTGYGVLDWKLRRDERVVVMERTNALHAALPEKVDLVVADVGWTPMIRIAPLALSLLKDEGCAVALMKPQYESEEHERHNGVVLPECLDAVIGRVLDGLAQQGIAIAKQAPSRLPGSGGNREIFVVLKRGYRAEFPVA